MEAGWLSFSRSEAYSMLDAASAEFDKLHAQGLENSQYFEFINGIDAEVTNILPMLR